ncbi:metallophosphoesterase family protein [Candidatus Poribacteria bacterium]
MRIKRRMSLLFVLAMLFFGQIAVNTTKAEIIRGPYLCDVTKESIAIGWETKEASGTVVEYTTDAQYAASGGAYDEQAEEPGDVKRHKIILRNLMPSASYHYRVVSDPDEGEDNSFHTAVEWSEPFTLIAYGDTRTNPADHQVVVDTIIEHQPDLVLNSGDLVDNGNVLGQWDTFFDTAKDLLKGTPYYPTLGNHDNNAQNYYDLFYLPTAGGKEDEQWYSFDYGNAHIVCLDSEVLYSADQLSWLEDDLARAASTAQWIFVNFHHPPYSSGKHGSEFASMPEWIDAFERYGVDIVFSGHDHIYERSVNNDIWYIVTGGGGAPRYSVNAKPNPYQVYAESTLHFTKVRVDGAQLTLEMIRPDGTVGDTMVVEETTGVASANRLPVTWGKIKSEGRDH